MKTKNVETKMEETKKKQQMRDQLVRKQLENLNIQFPLHEKEFETHINFFVEESLSNKMINFLFIKKTEEIEIEYNVISNGLQKKYNTKKEAFNAITNSNGVVLFYSLKV